MVSILLPDRAVLAVSGADAAVFLQALITTDIAMIEAGQSWPGALLTPQGKILFSFMIARDGDGFRIETAAANGADLLKRLTLYKLRAAVTLSLEVPATVTLVTGGSAPPASGLRDMRFHRAGLEMWRVPGANDGDGDPDAYTTLRIAAGIAEEGTDYALQDAFPHDVLMDRNGALSFRKGCYVGQEVVSRMQHRGTARRRVVIVTADTMLPATGSTITAGGKTIGTLGSVSGVQGLGIVRIDKAGEAIQSGQAILAGDVAVTLALPAWSELSFPIETAAEAGA